MDKDRFVEEIHRLVLAAWDERNYLAWFILSAALLGARIGRVIWRDER